MPSINNLKIVSGGTEYDVPIGKGLQIDVQTYKNTFYNTHTFSKTGAIAYVCAHRENTIDKTDVGGAVLSVSQICLHKQLQLVYSSVIGKNPHSYRSVA